MLVVGDRGEFLELAAVKSSVDGEMFASIYFFAGLVFLPDRLRHLRKEKMVKQYTLLFHICSVHRVKKSASVLFSNLAN